MKKMFQTTKKVGAVSLCLALLCGTICGAVMSPISASAEDSKTVYSVDFSDLADIVDDSSYDNGLYRSAMNDTTINEWVNSRFKMVFNRENKENNPSQRSYLGQSSYELDSETDSNGDNYADEMYWAIDKDGYLLHA